MNATKTLFKNSRNVTELLFHPANFDQEYERGMEDMKKSISDMMTMDDDKKVDADEDKDDASHTRDGHHHDHVHMSMDPGHFDDMMTNIYT